MCVARIDDRQRDQRRWVRDERRRAHAGHLICSADYEVEVVRGGFAREVFLDIAVEITRDCTAKSSGNGAVRAACVGAVVGWSCFVSKRRTRLVCGDRGRMSIG